MVVNVTVNNISIMQLVLLVEEIGGPGENLQPSTGVVDFGFDYQSDQTKDYKIGNCCFSPAKACSISEYE
jgi:hypothetical protein